MSNFNINTAEYISHFGCWIDDNGNHISENEYYKLLSASTWDEIDPDLIDLDDPGQVPYEESLSEEAFAEYIMGINL